MISKVLRLLRISSPYICTECNLGKSDFPLFFHSSIRVLAGKLSQEENGGAQAPLEESYPVKTWHKLNEVAGHLVEN